MKTRQVMNAYAQALLAELLRHARMPGFVVPTLVFPSLLCLVLIGLVPPAHDKSAHLFWLANYASFAAIPPGLFVFGISTAFERNTGFLDLRRALPGPAYAYSCAKLGVVMLATMLGVLLLILVAGSTGHVLPPSVRLLRLILVEMYGSLPFRSLGLLIGGFVHEATQSGW